MSFVSEFQNFILFLNPHSNLCRMEKKKIAVNKFPSFWGLNNINDLVYYVYEWFYSWVQSESQDVDHLSKIYTCDTKEKKLPKHFTKNNFKLKGKIDALEQYDISLLRKVSYYINFLT